MLAGLALVLLATAPLAQARPLAVQAVIVAPMAPPPLQIEVIPAPPFTSAVWIPGHWFWAGGRYAWLPGHYAYPHARLRWVAPHWRQRAGGWYFVPGRWAR